MNSSAFGGAALTKDFHQFVEQIETASCHLTCRNTQNGRKTLQTSHYLVYPSV